MEDLQHILPDQLKEISNKKIYVVLISLIGGFALLSVILGCVLVVKHVKNPGGNNGMFGPGKTAALTAYPPKPPPGVCVQPDCLRTAAYMAENMNKKVDPCDNFYQYACGGWVKKNSIPPGWGSYSVYSQVRDANEEKLRELIQSAVPVNSQSATERKLKDFYTSCMHDYGRMEEGGRVVIDIIKNKFGGWYALDPDNWQSSQWDSTAAMTSVISDYLVGALFRLDVYPDKRDRSKNIITIKSAYLGMYSNYYLNDDKIHVQEKYKTFIKDIGRLLLRDANVTMNDTKHEEALQTFVDDVYWQEKQVAIGITKKRRESNYYYSPILTVEELARNYTQIDWLSILKGYFGPDISSNTEVYLRSKPYFDMIDEILRNETENKNRILNNFLVWQFVDTYGPHLSWEYRINAQYFNEPFRGPSDMVPTWQQCLYTIEDRLGSVLAGEFIHNHVGADGQNQVKKMFDQMQKAYVTVAQNTKWMDNTTKARAQEKMSKVTALIGFPDSYFDKDFLNRLHSSLVINKTAGYFTNLMNTNVFMKKLERMQLDAGSQYYKWRYATHRGAFQVLLRFFYNSNEIMVPAGSMQFPYMDPKRKSFIAAGGLGSRMAQAMFYSVGDTGKYRWHNGTYWNWWTLNSYTKYIQSRDCFQNYMTRIQAGPYLINGENITITVRPYSAVRIMREMGGVQLAYETFKSDPNKTVNVPLGVTLSPEQSFFLSYAQTKCSISSDRSAYSKIRSSSYTSEIGVNFILSQMEEFSSAFKCAANKKMNVQSRCSYM